MAHSQSLFPFDWREERQTERERKREREGEREREREREKWTNLYAWDLWISWDTALSVLQASHVLGDLGWTGYPKVKVHKHIDFQCGKIVGTTNRVARCFYFTPMSCARATKWYSKTFSCYKKNYIQAHEGFFLSSHFFLWRILWVLFLEQIFIHCLTFVLPLDTINFIIIYASVDYNKTLSF